MREPVIFDVATRSTIQIDHALFPNPYLISQFRWYRDSRGFTFEYNQRGHQVYRVIEVNAATGATRAVIDEESPTFIYYNSTNEGLSAGKHYRFDVNDGKEIAWMSERDGWNHLYLYDGARAQVKNQITKGEWVVRNVERIDTVARQIYFSGNGMNAGEDPYLLHHFRINFDGSALTPLTPAKGNHAIAWSPDAQYYADTYSRVDATPVTEIRSGADQSLVMTLEKPDLSALTKAGWRAPEVFVSKARDGKTDIWGVIYRPSSYDAKKKYPVIENIYGPRSAGVLLSTCGLVARCVSVERSLTALNHRPRAAQPRSTHAAPVRGPDRHVSERADNRMRPGPSLPPPAFRSPLGECESWSAKGNRTRTW